MDAESINAAWRGPSMTTEQKIIRAKVGLLELAKQLGNVSQACKIMGYSRDSFYRFQGLYDKGGDAEPEQIGKLLKLANCVRKSGLTATSRAQPLG
jgi:hypothetical protein